MNKAYKSIFNESTGTYVAVSETAKSKTKGAAILSVCLAVIMTTTNVFAQTIDANNSIEFGTSAYQGSGGQSNVSIGTASGQNATGDYNNNLGAAAGMSSIGSDNNYIGFTAGVVVRGSGNIAIGLGALNAGTAAPLGASGAGVIPFGSGSGGSFTGSGNVVLGTNAAVTNSAKGVATDSTVVLGELAKAQVSNSVAIGSMSVASRISGIAGYIPVGATASQQTAINATQSTRAAVSVGDESQGLYRQITAVAAGTADTDAVNVAQLKAVTTEVMAGSNVQDVTTSTGANGQTIYTVNAKGTTASAGSTAVTVTSKAGANNVTDYAVDLSQTTKDDIKAGVDAKDAVDNTGLTFNGDSGTTGIKKLGDAVAVTGDANITTEATAAGVAIKLNPQIDLGALGSVTMGNTVVNTNGLTIVGGASVTSAGVNAGGSKITNVAAGTANTDAVNVSQLKEVSDVANAGWNIATDSGAVSNVKPSDTVNFNGDGNGNVIVSNVGNDVTVGLADKVTIGKGGTAVTIDGTNGQVTVGDTTINSDGLTIAGGPSMTKNGIDAGGKQITNIASGLGGQKLEEVTGDDLNNAVNVGDLQTIINGIDLATTEVGAGKNVSVASSTGADGQTVYTVATKDEVDFNKITVGGLTIDKIKVDVAGNTIISGVGKGELSSTSTDAVNGSQLYATNQNVTNINNTLDKGLNFSADSGTTVNRKLGDTVAIIGDDKNITTTTTANGVQIKLSDNIDVKNVKVSESITVAEGAKVDMGGNVIQNVAPGVNGTDAVNVNQVNAVAGNLNNRINRVGHIANAGVAQAIATAGLPQAYLPGKSMMAVAGGTYEGETGYAIGFSTISDNGKWIIKVTGSGNSRDKYGASLGAGYQW